MSSKKKYLCLAIAATILVGCGNSKTDGANDSSVEIGEVKQEGDSEEAAAFGEKTAAENPLSDETKSKLDALNTNYKKVNWDVVYSAPDNNGIVISETKFYDKQDSLNNILVVAYTNVTDAPVKFSCEGFAEDAAGEVAVDILESDIELGPNNTIAVKYDCENDEPSGNIRWNNFTVEPSDKEYVPYEISTELKQDSGYYCIEVEYSSDYDFNPDVCPHGYGYVLDKDGKIIGGDEEENWGKSVQLWAKSYDGENADTVFFKNIYNR
ncbi:hypothetical protein [Pseudobutyrivibrio sp.]|uniref:hypothetical protein n=1 Tax=Pseudobutyrivibrio sp. TaxID=2014367 RepID=UPI0025E49C73|nr:hypothetical protein [Pseudobutyrivibrio sp.]MBR5650281.1 hypothetical protein [Pseudobutyrivibrio sp.]